MRRAVRAIVINNDKLLVMHRNKFGKEYDTLPGGNIELGETPQQALEREVGEETQLTISNPRMVFVEHAGVPYGDQLIFLCDFAGGEPTLQPGSEEDHINKMGKNLYQPGWVKISDLENLPFLSENLKRRILEAVKSGWPQAPIEF